MDSTEVADSTVGVGFSDSLPWETGGAQSPVGGGWDFSMCRWRNASVVKESSQWEQRRTWDVSVWLLSEKTTINHNVTNITHPSNFKEVKVKKNWQMKQVPADFNLINQIWVQDSLKSARSLSLGQTMSSSPGLMERQQWKKMLSLYCTASRLASFLLRANLTYLHLRGKHILKFCVQVFDFNVLFIFFRNLTQCIYRWLY